MEDKERANMVLKRIGEMPYFDPDAIVKVLVNEFELIRKEAAQPSAQAADVGQADLLPCGHSYDKLGGDFVGNSFCVACRDGNKP